MSDGTDRVRLVAYIKETDEMLIGADRKTQDVLFQKDLQSQLIMDATRRCRKRTSQASSTVVSAATETMRESMRSGSADQHGSWRHII